jgi:hypothetical protein
VKKKKRDPINPITFLEKGGDERIRTAGAAFAEPCLTTWRRRHAAFCPEKGAGDGDRTRDFLLGKEMLYH